MRWNCCSLGNLIFGIEPKPSPPLPWKHELSFSAKEDVVVMRPESVIGSMNTLGT